ncbi:T-lymphocyte surface antigen Ly-9 isoform X5 [Phacochoerus africanus]|uniref:T-lymphocyte surface antigen Ly-9 isoform X5 n=1 Tax=Phacochoerus africanus TaxID=41426 RepID=UPI001FD9EA6F|nr:T-lymphocyte surface antigen Ly-9 isoform X5 [Phacochoerus africanus]
MASPRRQIYGRALQPSSSKTLKSQPHIFSPFLWIPLLFLLMGLGASHSTPTVVRGLLGGSVILPLNISVDMEIEHIAWNDPQNALALVTPRSDIILMDRSYQGRINIFAQNNSLSINKLTWKDAGSYKAQINQKNSKVTINEEFFLHIYEQLQEPQVTMTSVNMSENASCDFTLLCSVEGTGEDVQYHWTSRDPHAVKSLDGSTLTISWLPCDPDVPYICTAKNPVSQSSSRPVYAWQFCTGPGASRGEPTGETVMGILGESITLSLALQDSQHIENVVWMFNTSIISKEQGEAATANQLTEFKDPHKNMLWVSNQDYSLKISQLRMEDAGPYHAYVCSHTRVAITKHFNLLVYGPERRSIKLWVWLSLIIFSLLFFGISGWCLWKKKRCSAPVSSSSQEEAPADTPGYEKLDTFPKAVRQQPRHSSDSSSDSNGTTEEDEDRTEMYQPNDGRDQMCDLDSEGQAEYELVTPGGTAPSFVVEGETVYTQVFLDLQGKTPVPQTKESSTTIYCSIQKPQKMVPPSPQNDLESSEVPTYENVT